MTQYFLFKCLHARRGQEIGLVALLMLENRQ
jgi:hypothetical protein